MDFFAGSGTTGIACLELGRQFILVDNNPESLDVMARRFQGLSDIDWVGFDPKSNQSQKPQPAEQGNLFDLLPTNSQAD